MKKSNCEHFDSCDCKYFTNSKSEKKDDCVLAKAKNNCVIFKNFLNKNGIFTTERGRDF